MRNIAAITNLGTVQAYVYHFLAKLRPVHEALVQKENNWKNRSLEDLMENRRMYEDRNSAETSTYHENFALTIANVGIPQKAKTVNLEDA